MKKVQKSVHLFITQQKVTRFINGLFLVVLSLGIAALMVLYLDVLPSNVKVGNIATHDIRADQNYELVDVKSTNKLREEAASSVLPVFEYDKRLASDRIQKVHESFKKARTLLQGLAGSDKTMLPDDKEMELRQEFQIDLGLALTDSDYKLIRESGFSEDLEQVLTAMLEPVQRRPIIEDKNDLQTKGANGIVLRVLSKAPEEMVEKNINKFDEFMSRQHAQRFYEEQESKEIKNHLHLDFTNTSTIKKAKALFPQFIKSNITYNKIETELQRDRARSNIQNIIYKLQKGQIIIRSGDRYEPWHISVLEGIREARMQTNVILQFFGIFILVMTLILTTFYFGKKHIKKFHPERKDLYFLGLLLFGFITLLRLGSFVSTGLKDTVQFSADITTFYYLIPVAAGAMLIRYILNSETALMFSIVVSLLSGIFLENNLEITVYYLISSVVAAHLIGHVEKRSTVFRCGFYLGLINILVVLSLNLVNKIAMSASVDLQALLANCTFAFFGGILTSLVLLAISPIMETLFNYTTNIQLLELANMNHPLLREMIVRAPGTYHHSQLVGILAEAGAQAVGANSLLARVGSYYHDIGKMKKPQYFIENQKGDNPHDRLSPTMSALIIEAHVKDGIEMAKDFKLPQVITSFIPEHQGTKLIGYFYNKAKKMSDPNLQKVDEKDFRYKGPLPQSRESGIVMLADTIEAAVRSMPEKSPQKIHAMVEKLVNMHFVDGQLNQCDLTLKDLHLIVEAFVKILIGIYHQRVEYPEQQQKKSSVKLVKNENQAQKNANSRHQQSSQKNNIAPLFKEKN